MSNTIIEILIDKSGSMGYMTGSPEHEGKYLIEGVTRMTLIKEILANDIIPTIDYSNEVIIRTFRSNNYKVENIVTEELELNTIFEGVFDKNNILSIIESIQDPPIGGTPITAAINASIENLKKYPDWDRKIILLTDGEENGGGNFEEAANKAEHLEGIPCKIFILGLAQDEQAEQKSRSIASGGYYNIKSKSFSRDDIQKALSPLKEAILQNTIQNVQTSIKTVNPKPQQDLNGKDSQSLVEVIKDPIPKIEIVSKKIDEIRQKQKESTLSKLEELESKIMEQVINTQKLLSELISIKELIRIDNLLDSGIDATTLTIDSDYSEGIRQRSEQFLYKVLCEKYGQTKVKWLNEKGESYNHHDFELLNEWGDIIALIECKGTPNTKPTFYLTSKEWAHFLNHKENYQLYRVFNVDGDMNVVCLDNLHTSIINQEVVPYLLKPEILKEGRVFLTLSKK